MRVTVGRQYHLLRIAHGKDIHLFHLYGKSIKHWKSEVLSFYGTILQKCLFLQKRIDKLPSRIVRFQIFQRNPIQQSNFIDYRTRICHDSINLFLIRRIQITNDT